jgi:F0F1-type ATP synthase assembly protein I
VTTVGFEFVLPPLAGALLDRRYATGPLGILAGAVLGFVVGMMHILRIAREGTKD